NGDVVRANGRPAGRSFFADLDPPAAGIVVSPAETTDAVRTQQVLIATVLDESGNARRHRRVEWMLEGVGSIVEVDGRGALPGRGGKVDNQYAVGFTDVFEHLLSRGNGNPADD